MRIRWLPIALGVSLLANIGLAALVLVTALDAGHYQTDQQSSWSSMAGERVQLRDMRANFCPDNPRPARAEVLAWQATERLAESHAVPYDKDGLLWLQGDAGVKFDDEGRVSGVCLY